MYTVFELLVLHSTQDHSRLESALAPRPPAGITMSTKKVRSDQYNFDAPRFADLTKEKQTASAMSPGATNWFSACGLAMVSQRSRSPHLTIASRLPLVLHRHERARDGTDPRISRCAAATSATATASAACGGITAAHARTTNPRVQCDACDDQHPRRAGHRAALVG